MSSQNLAKNREASVLFEVAPLLRCASRYEASGRTDREDSRASHGRQLYDAQVYPEQDGPEAAIEEPAVFAAPPLKVEIFRLT